MPGSALEQLTDQVGHGGGIRQCRRYGLLYRGILNLCTAERPLLSVSYCSRSAVSPNIIPIFSSDQCVVIAIHTCTTVPGEPGTLPGLGGQEEDCLVHTRTEPHRLFTCRSSPLETHSISYSMVCRILPPCPRLLLQSTFSAVRASIYVSRSCRSCRKVSPAL